MSMIFALMAAVAVFFGYLLLDQRRLDAKRRESLRSRISPTGEVHTGDFDDGVNTTIDNEPSAHAKMMLGILKITGVNVDESIRKLEKRFAQAGIMSPDAPINYLFFQRILSIVFVLIGVFIVMQGGEGLDRIKHGLAGIILMVGGVFGPYLFLKNKIDHRKKILERAFPDTLDLLLICVESGLALDAALTRVCSELGRAYPDMTGELNRTRLELALINDRVRALMNLGERTDMVAFRSLVAALIQSERFGTSLTDTLRVLSEDFRLLRLSHAEAKAARLPVLLTIPLIFFLMPAFMLIVLGPAIVKFARQGSMVAG